jgi:hypothetical protein
MNKRIHGDEKNNKILILEYKVWEKILKNFYKILENGMK